MPIVLSDYHVPPGKVTFFYFPILEMYYYMIHDIFSGTSVSYFAFISSAKNAQYKDAATFVPERWLR